MNKGKTLIMTGAFGFFLVLLIGIFLDTPDGAAIFNKEGCAGCHSFKGHGGSAGPDLTAVTARRTSGWIRDQIRDPKKHNPASMMPGYRHLSWTELNALITYLGG